MSFIQSFSIRPAAVGVACASPLAVEHRGTAWRASPVATTSTSSALLKNPALSLFMPYPSLPITQSSRNLPLRTNPQFSAYADHDRCTYAGSLRRPGRGARGYEWEYGFRCDVDLSSLVTTVHIEDRMVLTPIRHIVSLPHARRRLTPDAFMTARRESYGDKKRSSIKTSAFCATDLAPL